MWRQTGCTPLLSTSESLQGLLWGCQLRDLQHKVFSSSTWGVLTDFMRCKVSYYPSNPSAAIPEAEKFSQNPKEKYLYMDFYDLKSALAIDLSPLLAEKCWLWRWCCQIPHCMVRLCTTPTKDKMKVNPNLKNMPTTSLPQCPLFVLFMLYQQIIQTLPEGKCQYTVENGRTPRCSTWVYDPNMWAQRSLIVKTGLSLNPFRNL